MKKLYSGVRCESRNQFTLKRNMFNGVGREFSVSLIASHVSLIDTEGDL